jgi:hypothetical protein
LLPRCERQVDLSFDVIFDDLLPIHIFTLELLVHRMENQNGGIAIGAKVGVASSNIMGLGPGPWGATTAGSTMPAKSLNPYRAQIDRNAQKS